MVTYICHYDITEYEQGDLFGKQGLLLGLTLELSAESWEDEDIDAFKKSNSFQSWAKAKNRVYEIPKALLSVGNWFYTISDNLPHFLYCLN